MVTDQAGEMIALGQGEMPVTTVERQRALKFIFSHWGGLPCYHRGVTDAAGVCEIGMQEQLITIKQIVSFDSVC